MDDEARTKDPAALAQSMFARLQENQPGGEAEAPPAQGMPPAVRDDLLLVVRDLEQVTQSLIQTSSALADIARALAG